MSTLEVNSIQPLSSGNTITLGANGKTLDVPSGATLDLTGSTVSGLTTGKIGQVVNVTKTNTETSSSTSYVDVGMSITITPSATSSKVLLMFHPRIGSNTGSANVMMKIQNATADTIVTGSSPFAVSRWPSDGQSAYYTQPQPMVVVDSPNTSSAVEYKLQMKTNAGGFTINAPSNTGGYSNTEISTITALEILT
tara:strand:- start:553 stop:1137 length:585 start_codon:yes stop_codon:yes gene_type:complete